MKLDQKELKVRAEILKTEGETVREIARKLGVSKTTIARWLKTGDGLEQVESSANPAVEEAAVIAKTKAKDIEVSDRYSNYIESLKGVRDRQSKWAGAVTETGIRSLKLANKFLAVVEKQGELSKSDFALIRLVPSLMTASSTAIKSAAEAEDRAYSLELLVDTLNELPQQIQAANRKTDPKSVATEH